VAIRSRTVENLVSTPVSSWSGRQVFVTGHTGFKGSWLAAWLQRLGASVHGYALNPPTQPSLFDEARISSLLSSDTRADLADITRLRGALHASRAEVLFHLAAQPLVRESYRDPLGTLATNVMGTANVLEAARSLESLRAIVVITTDKVYENRNWTFPYRETDALGGHDPYSASKAASEIVVASYRASFFSRPAGHAALMATARAGNVIGGGDWAAERLVPDCLRAFQNETPVHLRFPKSVRPWQHVLDPLAGYMRLAERLLEESGEAYAHAWNFGPDLSSDATVGAVAQLMARLWGGEARVIEAPSTNNPPEHELLRLDSSTSRARLGWQPRWPLQRALEATVAWHRAWLGGADMRAICAEQIGQYEATMPA
jgi:CDP-glucose 4,6-dehydratase